MGTVLLLENGSIFYGESFGMKGEIVGEIVFNTGMTGYQEVLTDPSYCGQLVTMTYPLIGNYGINYRDMESDKPYLNGFIVREHCKEYSNFRAKENIEDFLIENGIIGISGIDTRALTKIIREIGTMKATITSEKGFSLAASMKKIKEWSPGDLVAKVSRKDILKIGTHKAHNEMVNADQILNESSKALEKNGKSNDSNLGNRNNYKIALIDYGLKKNIVRSLLKKNCNVTIFPHDVSATEILEENPDGIMLSNGPGDPKECKEQIETLKNLIGKRPMFGICLGHQLLALSQGADTEKLKYGHRGSNHPVKDLKKDRTYITSQNHGYTIITDSLANTNIEISHTNLNDNSIEGLNYKGQNAFTVQFHPEASPGPRETEYLFDEFVKLMEDFINNDYPESVFI